MRLALLLDDTAISGKTRALMTVADTLVDRGHQVRIVTAGTPVTWRSSRAEWVYVDEMAQFTSATNERVIDFAPEMLVEDEFFRPASSREHEPLRVLLAGSWDCERHGIEDGYGAVAHARWFHQKFDLIRVAPHAPSREEPLEAVQEFHVALTTSEMTRLVQTCDVFLGSNRREDDFPLPTAEALASGLACVLTSIPPFLAIAPTRDYALFAPDDNAVELGEKLIELLSDGELRDRIRASGRKAAEQWRVTRVLERAFPES
jgi:glycosyltransferase involved in cell wall biosynthesis